MKLSMTIMNTICTDLGGVGSHRYEIQALNEMCTLLGGVGAHRYNIDALNELCTLQGVTSGHALNIRALNALCSGSFRYECDAYESIQQGGLLNGLFKPKWLAIGDSVTAANNYQQKVATALNYEVTTHAKSGIGMVASVFGTTGLPALTAADLADKDLVTLFAGFNDRQLNDGLVTDMYPTQDTYAGRLNYTLGKLKALAVEANNTTVKIISIAPYNCGKYDWIDADGDDIYPPLSSYSLATKAVIQQAVCDALEIQMINLFTLSSFGASTWNTLSASTLPTNQYTYKGEVANVGALPAGVLNDCARVVGVSNAYIHNGTSWVLGSSPYPYNSDQLHPNNAGYQNIADVISSQIFKASFVIDTTLAQLNWVDLYEGEAQYEIYSSINGADLVLLATTDAGVTSYQDTTCKQNATVIYKIRGKKNSQYSSFYTSVVLNTPLCWKVNQEILSAIVIQALNITTGKTVKINWGDGTSADLIGNNASVTKNYAEVGHYNISLSGDTDWITNFTHANNVKIYGNLTNWILPSVLGQFNMRTTSITGNPNWILPNTLGTLALYATGLTGKLPSLVSGGVAFISYQAQGSAFSDSDFTVFKRGMTAFDVGSQTVAFITAKVDKILKALADYYQSNAPTANCSFTLNGVNMGIPTGGNLNADIVRLKGYYTAAGFTATVTVNT